MTKTRTLATALLLCVLSPVAALATPKDQAVKLVKEAASLVQKVGKEKALVELSKADGAYSQGELYVFAYDLHGVIVVHPRNPKLVGKNLLEVPDVDGKLFRKEIVSVATSKGQGWVDYKYKNPETGAVEEKTTWVMKVGDLVLCCGIYR
jgi:cytochrome c